MPSFCWPFFGPKPAMIRPRTGQRKVGALPVDSAAGSLGGSAGAAIWAVRGGAVFWPAGGAAGAALGGLAVPASATLVAPSGGACLAGGAGGWVATAAGLMPGMVSRWPIFTWVSGAILLAFAITPRGLP